MNDVTERAKQIVGEVLKINPAQVTVKSNFVEDLGADSLDLIELILRLEEEFNIQISEAEARQIKTMQHALTILLPKAALPVGHD